MTMMCSTGRQKPARPAPKKPRNTAPYTAQEDELILSMHAAGVAYAAIARQINRTEPSVEYRHHTLMRYEGHGGRQSGRDGVLCGDCSLWKRDGRQDSRGYRTGICAKAGKRTARGDWCRFI